MTTNLIRAEWKSLDQVELRLLLDKRIGGPGQYDGRIGNPNALHLPLARSSCRIKLTFRDKKIIVVEPGPAFDAAEWERICEEIEKSILSGTCKVGREYSFSSFRVLGSWHGIRSGVQILVPPEDAPSAPVEIADHPFILEFPVKASDQDWVTNHRRIREHRRLTQLLNVLLRGRTRFQQRRVEHCWASVPEIKWVEPSFFARLGQLLTDALSPTAGQCLEEVEPGEYYTTVGNDGKGLRVPSDLDHSICLYFQLSPPNLTRFDRALFWMDVSSRQWTISISSSFASLVSAAEALTERGTTHEVYCERCKSKCQHEVPGATERFRAFFEKYAPGAALRSRRSEMYALRSDILHGSDLMQLDQDLAFGWDPPGWNEGELYKELWSLTRIAVRNWLRNPGG